MQEKNRKKNIVMILILLVIAILAAGFYFYNRGAVNIKNSTAIKINATALYEAYKADSSYSQKKYSGKVLLVWGVVSKIAHNQQGEMIVLLTTNEQAGFVNCTLEQKSTTIKVNDSIQVKGICSGMGQSEPDLGITGDVYLTRSIIIKH